MDFFVVQYLDFYPYYLLDLVFEVVDDFSFVADIVSDSDGHSSSALSGFVYPGYVAF